MSRQYYDPGGQPKRRNWLKAYINAQAEMTQQPPRSSTTHADRIRMLRAENKRIRRRERNRGLANVG